MNINQNSNFGTHNTSVRPGKIEYIVMHYVGATGDAKANLNYYNQKTTINASADFFVEFNGDIWQYNPNPKARYCWVVGVKKLSTGGGSLYGIAKNANCINIEMCVRNSNSKDSDSRDWYFEDATAQARIRDGAGNIREMENIDRKIWPVVKTIRTHHGNMHNRLFCHGKLHS